MIKQYLCKHIIQIPLNAKTLAVLLHQPGLPISNRVNAAYNLHTQGVLKLGGILGELLTEVGEASLISGSHKIEVLVIFFIALF